MTIRKPKRRVPWHVPPAIAARRTKIARLKRKGMLPDPPSHARSAAEQALIDFITREIKPIVR